MDSLKRNGFLLLLFTVTLGYFLSRFTLAQDFLSTRKTGNGWIHCFALGLLLLLDIVYTNFFTFRKRLFNMINDVPTIFEVVTGMAKKQSKDKPSAANQNGNKSKSNSKVVRPLLSFLTLCFCSFQKLISLK